MEQLGGLDAMFLHAELHGLPMHISSLTIYDPSTAPGGKVEFRQIVDLFERKVQNAVPALRKKLLNVPFGLDQPYWVEDTHFDLVYHIRHIALPKPANWQKLCSLAANLHAQPLNRTRPLWEAYVIDGLDHIEDVPPGSFAILLKVHHSIMDGRTGMAIYSSLHSLSADPAAVDELHMGRDIEHVPDMTARRLLMKACRNNVDKTVNLMKLLGRSVSLFGQVQLAVRNKELKQLHKPKTRFNGTISPRRVIDRIRLPLVDIRLIKSCFADETINDVGLAIVSGALRRYLSAKGELPEDSLVAAVPIDIRDRQDDRMSGNRVNIMNVSLCTDEADPLERLRRVHREAQSSKAFSRKLGAGLVHEVLDSVYAGLISWGIRTAVESGLLEKFPPINNTVVTNVVGAKVPMYLCGAKLVDSIGMGPLLPNTGLFHTISSTYDFLSIAFTADRQKMDDPDFYVQCLEDSFIELLEAAKALQASREHAHATEPVVKKPVKRRSASNRIKPSRASAGQEVDATVNKPSASAVPESAAIVVEMENRVAGLEQAIAAVEALAQSQSDVAGSPPTVQ